MQKTFSLKAKIAVPIILVTVLGLGALTFISAQNSFSSAVTDAENFVTAAASSSANQVNAHLDASLAVARQVDAYLETAKSFGNEDRGKIHKVLKSMLKNAPSVFGVWATFEENAFDGADASYAGKPGFEKTGAFGPYWNRGGPNGEFAFENSVTYTGEFFTAPKNAGKPILTEPYQDTVNGQKVLLTSAAEPVYTNGKFHGVVGIDILLEDLVKQIAQVKPFSESQAYLISTGLKFVTNPDTEKIGKDIVFPFAEEEFKKVLTEGKSFLKTGYDKELKQEMLSIFVPIHISYSNQNWGIYITTPLTSVLAKAKELLWKQIITFIVCLLLMFTVVILISQKISKDFAQLTDKLEKSEQIVVNAIDQLNQSGQNLAASSTTSATSVEETVASLEEVTAMVQLNADNALEASRLSDSTSQSAEKGEAEMNELVSAMSEISSSSKKISDIISIIDDIAFQTNLLALNASVEAARAGEQGRGFAVVADAVRALAQRSADSAKDISGLIKDSVEKVARGSSKAGSSSENLREIVSSIKKINNINSEISSASKEQSVGIQQISKAMNLLDQSIQTNATSAEDISSTVKDILSQAQVMKSVVHEMNTVVKGSKAS